MSADDAIHDLLDSIAGSAIDPSRPADAALLELITHAAISDDVVEDSEIGLLSRLVPAWNDTEVHAWIGRVAAAPLDLPHIARALGTDDHRWSALRFIARMAAEDGHVASEEHTFLLRVADAFSLPPDAVERVLAEGRQWPSQVDPGVLRELGASVGWDAADFADGPVQSADLRAVVPEGATPSCRFGVDRAEVLGLYAEGFVARFLEGAAFIPWASIVSTSHGGSLESSLRIHTDSGRIWSLVDARMAGLARVFDRLRRQPARKSAAPAPAIERVVAPPEPDLGQEPETDEVAR